MLRACVVVSLVAYCVNGLDAKFGQESRNVVEAALQAKAPTLNVLELSDDELLLQFHQVLNDELLARAQSDPAEAIKWYESVQSALKPLPSSHGMWPWMDNDDLVNANPSARTTTTPPVPTTPKGKLLPNLELINKLSADGTLALQQETVFQIFPKTSTPLVHTTLRAQALVSTDAATQIDGGLGEVEVNQEKFRAVVKLALKQLESELANKGTLSPAEAPLFSEMKALMEAESTAEVQGLGWLSKDNLEALLSLKEKSA